MTGWANKYNISVFISFTNIYKAKTRCTYFCLNYSCLTSSESHGEIMLSKSKSKRLNVDGLIWIYSEKQIKVLYRRLSKSGSHVEWIQFNGLITVLSDNYQMKCVINVSFFPRLCNSRPPHKKRLERRYSWTSAG